MTPAGQIALLKEPDTTTVRMLGSRKDQLLSQSKLCEMENGDTGKANVTLFFMPISSIPCPATNNPVFPWALDKNKILSRYRKSIVISQSRACPGVYPVFYSLARW